MTSSLASARLWLILLTRRCSPSDFMLVDVMCESRFQQCLSPENSTLLSDRAEVRPSCPAGADFPRNICPFCCLGIHLSGFSYSPCIHICIYSSDIWPYNLAIAITSSLQHYQLPSSFPVHSSITTARSSIFVKSFLFPYSLSLFAIASSIGIHLRPTVFLLSISL
jgi:hypothetical protein